MGRGRAATNKSAQTSTHQNVQSRATDDARSSTPPDTPDTQWQTRDAIRYILILFLVSRAILTIVGVLARDHIGQLPNIGDIENFVLTTTGEIIVSDKRTRLDGSAQVGVGTDGQVRPLPTPGPDSIAQVGLGTGYTWLDIWGAWDTRWYITIAETWYSTGKDVFGYVPHAFFPLYPVLIKVFGLPFGNSYYGGVLVSNLAFLAGAWLLYKLVYEMKGHEMGKRAVLFMFLFPTAFMFSAVLTESLFAVLSIGAFYCARRKYWLVAGMLGGLSALTRLNGVFIGVLLFLEYMQQRQFRILAIRADVLCLALVPLGTFLFMLVGYVSEGNFFALFEAQAAWGGRSLENPVTVLWHSVDGSLAGQEPQFTLGPWTFSLGSWTLSLGPWTIASPMMMFGAILASYVLAVLAWGWKRLDFHLLVWCALLILIPLASSKIVATAMPRYMVVVFPIFLVFAHLRPGRVAYYVTAAGMILAQAFAMAFWTNNYHIL